VLKDDIFSSVFFAIIHDEEELSTERERERERERAFREACPCKEIMKICCENKKRSSSFSLIKFIWISIMSHFESSKAIECMNGTLRNDDMFVHFALAKQRGSNEVNVRCPFQSLRLKFSEEICCFNFLLARESSGWQSAFDRRALGRRHGMV